MTEIINSRPESLPPLEAITEFLLEQEEEVVRLMRAGDESLPLARASRLNCASVTQILAYRVANHFSNKHIVFRLDGEGEGLTEVNGHTVLGLSTQQGFAAIDGTIWQIHSEAAHFKLLGPFKTQGELIFALSKFYGGVWQLSQFLDAQLTPRLERMNIGLIQLTAARKVLEANTLF